MPDASTPPQHPSSGVAWRNTPLVLCILDGWGLAPPSPYNAIAQAPTPHWDRLVATCPMATLSTSGLDVGLPDGQMGNSEVGHMTIGSGRVIYQSLPRIDAAVANGSLASHPILQSALAQAHRTGKAVHLVGLLSPGGVHSHQNHLVALAETVATAQVPCHVHAILDGRDTPPQSAETYLKQVLPQLSQHPLLSIASISGRYYAMDRDKRWERIEKAYRAIVQAEAPRQPDALTALQQAYASQQTDEFVTPTVLADYTGVQEGDILLLANFRADRVRQLATALLDPAFTAFTRPGLPFAQALGMVEYSSQLNRFVQTLFPPEQPEHTLGEVVSAHGGRQLRIAETEKYAHVTFFFNGGREEPFSGEDRILIPSPAVATYDLQPEMAAPAVTDALIQTLQAGHTQLLVVNYANTDMVGHSGNLAATLEAVAAVDTCLGRLLHAVDAAGGSLLITADHGNAECMHDADTHQPHTAHTTLPVPFLIYGAAANALPHALGQGTLADIAPTCLSLMGLPIPASMQGKVLTLPVTATTTTTSATGGNR